MQQQKSSCTNCGTELLPDARFCRRCGQPSNPLERGSVTEVTTRRLETPGQPFMPGQGVTAQQALEQQSSGQTSAAAMSAETRSLAPTSTLKRLLPALLILCIALLLPTVYLLKKLRHPVIKIVPPTVEAPAVPQPPKPPKPPATWTTDSTGIDPAFIYPGARTTMVISKAGEGNVVQLQTEDPLNKVADWYADKLKPTEIFRQPKNVVLKAEDMSVIITPSGTGGSNIMIKQGAD